MHGSPVAFVFAAAVLSAPIAAQPSEPAAPVVTGPAISCINMRDIRRTNVVDDHTIDFVLAGNRVYRNTLDNRCPQLGFERAFSYQTSIPQLCAVDIITVIIQGSGNMRGTSCGLGKFTPIANPPAK